MNSSQTPGINCFNILLRSWIWLNVLLWPVHGITAHADVSVRLAVSPAIALPCQINTLLLQWTIDDARLLRVPYSIQFTDPENRQVLEIKDLLSRHAALMTGPVELMYHVPFHLDAELSGLDVRVTVGFLENIDGSPVSLRSETEIGDRVYANTFSVAERIPRCETRYLKPVYGEGCYPAELDRESGTVFHWLSPESHLQLPNPRSNSTLFLVFSGHRREADGSVTVSLNGTVLGKFIISDIPQRFVIQIPATFHPSSEMLDVLLIASTEYFLPDNDSRGDDRHLAIKLHHLGLYPE